MLPPFSLIHWLFAVLAALCIGLSKSGFPGVGLITVVIFAGLFPPLESTGILLPLLVSGDLCAVAAFRKHAQWAQIWRMLPPTLVGILSGYAVMQSIPATRFGPIIGWLILLMVTLQSLRKLRPALYEHVPHTWLFARAMGTWAGLTTMLANAAGPIMSLYFLAVNLPKYQLVGTSAWFFLLVNVFKIPFSAHLGLIHGRSMLLNLLLIPAVIAGTLVGRHLMAIIPQALFEAIMLIFAGLAALRLIEVF